MYGRDLELPLDELAAPSPPLPGPSISFTRRRLALLLAGLFALWLVGVFARQVSEAASAASQADQMRARNAAIERDISSLEKELTLIKQPAFVSQMARGYLLGTSREIPFTLDPNAPALPANAPGSIGIKPDLPVRTQSPLDSWLQVLFGSQ
jgi:cell division protein FtsB